MAVTMRVEKRAQGETGKEYEEEKIISIPRYVCPSSQLPVLRMLSREGAYLSILEKAVNACIAGSMPNPEAELMLLSRYCDGLGVVLLALLELTDVELISSGAMEEVSLSQFAQSSVKLTWRIESGLRCRSFIQSK